MIKLQVLICTIGSEGIKRVEQARHPEVEGVEYIVSWQQPDAPLTPPESLAKRPDFKIRITKSKGLSVNRNTALSITTAPFLLIGDDDVDYNPDALTSLIALMSRNPQVDIFTLRYTRDGKFTKPYPETETDFRHTVHGYYITSFEIVLRRDSVCGKLWFNPRLGIGNPVFASGEEDIFLHDALSLNLNIRFYPLTIGEHNHATTGERDFDSPAFIKTHGAVMSQLKPLTWPLRIIMHAVRAKRTHGTPLSFYLRNAFSGVRLARREKIFKPFTKN